MEGNDTISSLTDASAGSGRFLGVRVLAHPSVSRVGDFAALFEGSASSDSNTDSISRTHPEFRAVGGRVVGPLESRRITRAPLHVARVEAGLRLWSPGHAAVEVNGVPLRGERVLTREELEVGVIVLSGKDLALWIGWIERGESIRPVPGLIGESAAMLRVREQIHRVADLDVPVLLRGATGVGKELVAAAIHKHSRRAGQPYVAVNVAGFPSTMAASELFGYTRGAFTGAVHARDGYFEQANGGSLFLDEIGDVSFDVQALLLRAVQEGVIQPLGGKTRRVNVRLIAATDSDLESAVARREFREPLLRRFSYEIRIPPLRARREDIGILFYSLLRERLEMMGEAGRLSPSADGEPFVPAAYVARMALYEWPGNVRELANVALKLAVENRGRARAVVGEELWGAIRPRVEAAALASVPASSDRAAQVSGPAAGAGAGTEGGAGTDGGRGTGADESWPGARRSAGGRRSSPTEAEMLEALRAEGFRRERAAARLGVSKSYLHRWLIGSAAAPKAEDIAATDIEQALAACRGDVDAAAEKLSISTRALRLQFKRLNAPVPPQPSGGRGRP